MTDATEACLDYAEQKQREPVRASLPISLAPDVAIRLSLDEAAAAKKNLFDRATELTVDVDIANQRSGVICATVGIQLASAITKARLFGGEVLLFVAGAHYFHALAALSGEVAEKMRRAAAVGRAS